MKTTSINIFTENFQDSDSYFDHEVERVDVGVKFFPVLWESHYEKEFRSYLYGAIQRGIEEIKKHGSIRKAGYDVVITMQRIPSAHLRGDTRYSSQKLANFLLTTKYDLVPIIIGRSGYGLHLLDGHHRWRAYTMANIMPLVMNY